MRKLLIGFILAFAVLTCRNAYACDCQSSYSAFTEKRYKDLFEQWVSMAKGPSTEDRITVTKKCLVEFSNIETVDQLLRWLEMPASLDVPEAKLQLGILYARTKKDAVDSDKLLKRGFNYVSSIATPEFPDALFIQGMMYYEGLGTETNIAKGRGLIQKAAELGSHDAKSFVANVPLDTE